jgi:hypothetical protein
MDVKLLVYTHPGELERQIRKWTREYGYTLQGSVSIGTNPNGSTVYVATMVESPKKGGKK